MLEGWQGEEYLILFDELEPMDLSRQYDLDKYITGYKIVGLRGWDDFIVATPTGELFTIPTVPLDAKYRAPLSFRIDRSHLRPDERFRGRIKWYAKPICFGGNPADEANTNWVNLEEHVQLVKWWNQLYQEVKDSPNERTFLN